jgi:hypothetical protein
MITSNEFITQLKKNIIKRRGLNSSPETLPVKGCPPKEIDNILKKQRVQFIPKLYYQFLQHLGQDANDLFRGSDYSCARLPNLKDNAIDMLSYLEPPQILQDDAFVFLGHQGYVFYFFLTEQRLEDPPVYVVADFKKSAEICCDRLSAYFLSLGDCENKDGSL